MSLPKILFYLLHPAHLIHSEHTTAVTMSTTDTIARFSVQCMIMRPCHIVSDFRQIVELIDHPDIQSHRARLTMVTIYTLSVCLRRSKASDDTVIQLFLAKLIKLLQIYQMHCRHRQQGQSN